MISLADIFQSGMILQREKPVSVWGTASQGAEIRVNLQGQDVCTCADTEGKWIAVLQPLTASESETMIVSCGVDAIEIKDVAIGEVWIAGGQSNMEFHMRYEKHLPEVKSACENSRIRFYDVPEVAFDEQINCFDYSNVGVWRKASPEDIEYFSAVGYYFERSLEQALDVPVGIIGCNWGGTVAASWMDPETVRIAGPEWMEAYEEFAENVDWDDYWKRQRTGIQNNRGNLFEDPFNEFVMPRTPGPEEVAEFFKSMAETGNLPDIREGELSVHHIPGVLYEHMLKQIAPFSVQGVLWYQGESDDELLRSHLYENMLKGLIGDWRKLWNDDTLPFLMVQLPGFETWVGTSNHRYDLIRKAQQQVSEDVANTYLCSIGDVGEQFDIHPKNKLPVGERLALLARGHVYGEDILCDAPVPLSADKSGSSIIINFGNAEGGLHIEGGSVNDLSVTTEGSVLNYYTEVNGTKLEIHLDQNVDSPVRVDLAQSDFYLINLYNTSNIPALPFSITVEG